MQQCFPKSCAMKALVFFDYWWEAMTFWKMKRSNKFFIEIHNEFCLIAVKSHIGHVILFSSPLLNCRTPCATANAWIQRCYGMYSKTNDLLTAHSQHSLSVSMDRLSPTANPWGWPLQLCLFTIDKCKLKMRTISTGPHTALPFPHTARTQVKIPSQGVLWSEKFNFCPRHAMGRSSFIVIFLPPWWIKLPLTENYKEDAPIDSPASGIYTAIVLKGHKKDVQPEPDIGKKQLWPDGLPQLCRWVRVHSI